MSSGIRIRPLVMAVLFVPIFIGIFLFLAQSGDEGFLGSSGAEQTVYALGLAAIFSGIAVAFLIVGVALAIEMFGEFLQSMASPLLATVLFLWVLAYAFWQALIVASKLLLLIPLGLLFVSTRLIELWREIFYTCPFRECNYRGLPIYECSNCHTGNLKLWPNLYGLIWHYCSNCEERLPTLDLIGRKMLQRRCGGCEIPLRGRHAGKVPEKLVAIVGGPGSGKTNYLLMAIDEITNKGTNNTSSIHGEIDEVSEAAEFSRAWQELTEGRPATKTAEARRAFLLYAKVGNSRCQLYLYDAPGEEFVTIGAMTKQQYIPLLAGLILLVDPMSFAAVRTLESDNGSSFVPLQEVVTSTLAAATSSIGLGKGGQMKLKVAVVISKADLGAVRELIGDVRREQVDGSNCRDAIQRWGGENALRAIEHRFEKVEYFACSSLGREVDPRNREAFRGHGVLRPLNWILQG